MKGQQLENHSRLLAKLVRELIDGSSFDTIADLTDALKQRCAKLHIPVTVDDINDAYCLVGSNRQLVSGFRTKLRQDGTAPEPYTRDEARLIWRSLLRRHHDEQPSDDRERLDANPDLTRRLSSLSEPYVLAWFWEMVRGVSDRLELLAQLTHVIIERPADWSATEIRREHTLHKWSLPDDRCFACFSESRTYRHHIIEVQHGGSNGPRNQVPLCFACHKYLHPWLKQDDPEPSRWFTSLGAIVGRATR